MDYHTIKNMVAHIIIVAHEKKKKYFRVIFWKKKF